MVVRRVDDFVLLLCALVGDWSAEDVKDRVGLPDDGEEGGGDAVPEWGELVGGFVVDGVDVWVELADGVFEWEEGVGDAV